SEVTCGNVAPWSNEAATTGYHSAPLLIMKTAYTVPFGATVSAGSQELRLDPVDPGTDLGASNVLPPSVERANAIPRHPIHRSYTYPSLLSTASSTSAFCPEQDALISATGEMLYVAVPAADADA